MARDATLCVRVSLTQADEELRLADTSLKAFTLRTRTYGTFNGTRYNSTIWDNHACMWVDHNDERRYTIPEMRESSLQTYVTRCALLVAASCIHAQCLISHLLIYNTFTMVVTEEKN